MKGDQHVLPIGDIVDHNETRICWCGPRIEARCNDCDGTGCWKYYGGFAVVGVEDERPCIVIHNSADGREGAGGEANGTD